MRIIPAIDIMEGRCVRLVQGDFQQKKVYDRDPVEYALRLQEAGVRSLHLVDLDGARAGHPVNLSVLENICKKTRLKVDFGGGVKDGDGVQQVLDKGATQVTAGSMAVRDPDTVLLWLERFGPEKIILGADVKNEQVYIDGWKTRTQWNLFDFLDFYTWKGIQYVVCTDIARDGLLQGSAVALYRKILKRFPGMKLIASGGIHQTDDLDRLIRAGVEGAIVGKALLENKITLKQLKNYVG